MTGVMRIPRFGKRRLPVSYSQTAGPVHTSRKCAIMPRMAYDEDLVNRIRELIAADVDVTERKMFGGLAFLVGGHMSVAASREGGLMLRVDPEDTDTLLGKPHTRRFEMRGRELEGWLRVDPQSVRTKRQLEPWVKRGVAYARSLPPKR
jgi:TfoX/Sxy family transcriptional regulator of competence genes